MNKLPRLLGLCALTTALGGCFFGDDDDDTPPPAPEPVTQVPASAGASAQAYTGYIAGELMAMTNETAEPLGTDNIATAPTSETDEPVVVN